MLDALVLVLNVCLAGSLVGLIASYGSRRALLRSGPLIAANHRMLAWGLRLIALGYAAMAGGTVLRGAVDPRVADTVSLAAYPLFIGGLLTFDAALRRRVAEEAAPVRWGFG